MANHLVPCEGCGRHVRGCEPSCPFCGRAREACASGYAPVEVPASSFAGRAQMMGFGVTVGAAAIATALLTTGCPAYGAPAYGAPAIDAGQDSGAVDSGPDGSTATPAYGAPVPDGG